jgi:hypothetical protein
MHQNEAKPTERIKQQRVCGHIVTHRNLCKANMRVLEPHPSTHIGRAPMEIDSKDKDRLSIGKKHRCPPRRLAVHARTQGLYRVLHGPGLYNENIDDHRAEKNRMQPLTVKDPFKKKNANER